MKLTQNILYIYFTLLMTFNIIFSNNEGEGCMDDGYQIWSRNYGSPACSYDPTATIHIQNSCFYPDCDGCLPEECNDNINYDYNCGYIGDEGTDKCSKGFNRCSVGESVDEEDCILNDGLWYKYFYQDSIDCALNDGIWFRDGTDICGICDGKGAKNTGTCDCSGEPYGEAYYDACDSCIVESLELEDAFTITTLDILIEEKLLNQKIPVYLSKTDTLNSFYIEMEYNKKYIDIKDFEIDLEVLNDNYQIDYIASEVSDNINNIKLDLFYFPIFFECSSLSETNCTNNQCFWDSENNTCNLQQTNISLDCNSEKKEIFNIILDTIIPYDPNASDEDLISVKKIVLNENLIQIDADWNFGNITIYNPSQCNDSSACNYNETFHPYGFDDSQCEFAGDVGTEWENFCNCEGGTILDDCGDCEGDQFDGDLNSDGDICEDYNAGCGYGNLDCNNVCDGSAKLDVCGVCSEGNTGILASDTIFSSVGDTSYIGAFDCKGVCHGLAYFDGCDKCINYLADDIDCLTGEIKILSQINHLDSNNNDLFLDTNVNSDYNSIYGNRYYAYEDIISNSKTFYAIIHLDNLPNAIEGLAVGWEFENDKFEFLGDSLQSYVSGSEDDLIKGILSVEDYIIDTELISEIDSKSTYSSIIYFEQSSLNDSFSSGNILFIKFKPKKEYFENYENINDTSFIKLNYLQINENSINISIIDSLDKTFYIGDCTADLGGTISDFDLDEVCDDIDECKFDGLVDSNTDDLINEILPLLPFGDDIVGSGCLDIIKNIDFIPKEFSVSQNYPNPFNPSTFIEYSIPQYSNVMIDIFDINGSIINTLVNGLHQPGQYNVVWNGENKFGTLVPSGIYFYKIEADDFRSIKKLVLIK